MVIKTNKFKKLKRTKRINVTVECITIRGFICTLKSRKSIDTISNFL